MKGKFIYRYTANLPGPSCVQAQKAPQETNLLNPEINVSSSFPFCCISSSLACKDDTSGSGLVLELMS